MTRLISDALVICGTVVIVASSLAALSAPTVYVRLHYTTPVTSVGVPLVAIGLSVADGAGLTTASVLFPAALLFFSGPILNAAVAKTIVQREGHSRQGADD